MSLSPGRRVAAVMVLTALFVALAGCSTAEPGSAAVVGQVRIPESTVADQLRALNEATGQPAEAPNAEAAVASVNFNVAFELIRQSAEKVGVTVTQGQIDQYYAQQLQAFGGEEGLREAAAQQGLSPLLVRANFEAQMRVSEILNRIAPGGSQQEQSIAVQQLLAGVADEVGVEIAPKYGAWEPEEVQVVPLANPVSSAEPTAQATPVP